MSEEQKINKSIEFKTIDDEKGTVEAVFSVYNNVDSDGDVVVPGAIKSGFKDNQVPMVFAHKWDQPIGKGVIQTDDDKAVFKGSFFMGTEAGKEAYNLAKEMGDLQEWSFGFRINDYEVAPFSKDGSEEEQDVRYLKDLEVFEVSPVLVGANRETYTLAIKTGEETVYEKEETVSEEENLEEKYASCKHETDGSCYKEDKKGLDPDEEEESDGCCGNCGGESSEEGEEKISEDASSMTGQRFSEEVKDVLAALESLIVRAKAIEVLRSKDGRTLSERASSALRAVQEDLNDAWTEIDDILGEATDIAEAEAEVTEEVADNPVEETQGSTVEATDEVVEESVEVEEVVEAEESEEEVVEVVEEEPVVEEEVEEVSAEGADDEIDALFAESQELIADSILVELDEDEV